MSRIIGSSPRVRGTRSEMPIPSIPVRLIPARSEHGLAEAGGGAALGPEERENLAGGELQG
jgi:hypothetical protein